MIKRFLYQHYLKDFYEERRLLYGFSNGGFDVMVSRFHNHFKLYLWATGKSYII